VRHPAERYPRPPDRSPIRRDDRRHGYHRERVGSPIAHLAVDRGFRRRSTRPSAMRRRRSRSWASSAVGTLDEVSSSPHTHKGLPCPRLLDD
jgi:hypothetical protein